MSFRFHSIIVCALKKKKKKKRLSQFFKKGGRGTKNMCHCYVMVANLAGQNLLVTITVQLLLAGHNIRTAQQLLVRNESEETLTWSWSSLSLSCTSLATILRLFSEFSRDVLTASLQFPIAISSSSTREKPKIPCTKRNKETNLNLQEQNSLQFFMSSILRVL